MTNQLPFLLLCPSRQSEEQAVSNATNEEQTLTLHRYWRATESETLLKKVFRVCDFRWWCCCWRCSTGHQMDISVRIYTHVIISVWIFAWCFLVVVVEIFLVVSVCLICVFLLSSCVCSLLLFSSLFSFYHVSPCTVAEWTGRVRFSRLSLFAISYNTDADITSHGIPRKREKKKLKAVSHTRNVVYIRRALCSQFKLCMRVYAYDDVYIGNSFLVSFLFIQFRDDPTRRRPNPWRILVLSLMPVETHNLVVCYCGFCSSLTRAPAMNAVAWSFFYLF